MVKTIDNLCCVGKLKKSLLRVNKDALLECKCLKQKWPIFQNKKKKKSFLRQYPHDSHSQIAFKKLW